jgi:hypothetical protein
MSTSIDGMSQEFSSTTAAKQKYSSCQLSKKMGYDKKQLKELTKPLYSFGGKRIEPVGVITLPISFGTPQNLRTEYIIFDVVDMVYPYNAIFGWGLLNTFNTALHLGYLCLKIIATFGIIIVFDS